MKYNLAPEYISCLLLALIGVYMMFDRKTNSPKEMIFRVTLVFSIVSIINNILSIHAIEHSSEIPLMINLYVNTFYYFSVAVMTTMVAITTYVTMFEGRYDEPQLKTAVTVSLAFFALEVALVIANLATRWLFYFDENRHYHRGPLNAIGVVFLTISIVCVIWFGVVEWKRVKKFFRLILYVLPSIALLIGVAQYLFPMAILTGTIISFSLLTLFIAGQQQRAHIDALTELSNREAYFNDISQLCKRNTPYRIIIVGLKDFKQVNGQLGQRAGDAFLCMVGSFLTHLDPRLLAYRTSGVQFTLVATKISRENYEVLFYKVVERFSRSWKTETYETELRAVFADISCPEHAVGVDAVIASLEYATRLAKQDPNGKPVRFSGLLKEQFIRRNYVIAQMEKALKADLFHLNIQPVYDVSRQCFSGGEVLLRLNEDNGKPISPSEFIPIAIENGIATELGLMVMEKVCIFLQKNRNIDIGWLSINVSSQQDEFDDTVHHLEMLLDHYGVEPGKIKLEITEMVLLEDLERAHTTMDELARRGIGVYLDDFGTGYSNLANVMTLPFECVKIDKGLIRGITSNPKSRGMLEIVVSGLQSMNVIALAEGVETEEQDMIVRKLSIDRIQGFYYARPMPIDEFVWLIEQRCPIEPKPAE